MFGFKKSNEAKFTSIIEAACQTEIDTFEYEVIKIREGLESGVYVDGELREDFWNSVFDVYHDAVEKKVIGRVDLDDDVMNRYWAVRQVILENTSMGNKSPTAGEILFALVYATEERRITDREFKPLNRMQGELQQRVLDKYF